jgi:hypothetical protein
MYGITLTLIPEFDITQASMRKGRDRYPASRENRLAHNDFEIEFV